MDTKKIVPVIELSGTAYEIGHQHGEQLRDMIRGFSQSVYALHERNLRVAAGREDLKAFCRRNCGYLKDYSATLYEEMQGIADGCGLDFDDVLFLNSFLELEDLRPPELGGKLLGTKLWGCTSFNVLPAASSDGKPYVGQTYDMEQYYSKYNVVLKIHRTYGPDLLIYTLAGILGLNGMNSAGIGLTINKLVANDAREGVIYPFIVRKALDQVRVGDSFGAIVFAPRASGLHYQLASAEGVAWSIETSASYYELLPFDSAVSHTNYYLSETMRKYETSNWLSHGGTYVRYQVSSKILREHIGHIDRELLLNLMKDHTNYPRSICGHGFTEQDEYDAFCTIAAVLMDLQERKFYICHENPCANEFVCIDFTEK